MSTLTPTLRLRHAFDQGVKVFGTFIMLPSGRTAQVVAQTGLDAVIIDCEHGNIGDNNMHDAVFATAACGVSPIVRIRGTDPSLIKRALDAGAHALMVPMVNTAAEAELVIKSSKFPPLGVRGQGSPFTAFGHGITTPEYLKSANDTLITMVQIETAEAVKNAEEIAAVPGVDLLFIGPHDLAFSILGYSPAKHTEPEFLSALNSVHKAARKHGKKTGIIVSTGAQAKEAADKYDFVAIAGDVKALTCWFQEQLKHART